MIQGHDKALIFTSTKEACLAACLNEVSDTCCIQAVNNACSRPAKFEKNASTEATQQQRACHYQGRNFLRRHRSRKILAATKLLSRRRTEFTTSKRIISSSLFQKNFVCRSAEYNYVTLQCRLSNYDRRTVKDGYTAAELSPATGVDYFENLCLQGTLQKKSQSQKDILVRKRYNSGQRWEFFPQHRGSV